MIEFRQIEVKSLKEREKKEKKKESNFCVELHGSVDKIDSTIECESYEGIKIYKKNLVSDRNKGIIALTIFNNISLIELTKEQK